MSGDLGNHALARVTASVWAAGPSRTILLPVGSLEQHGPHLPMGTDLIIATAVCERAATEDPRLVVAPGVPYGVSQHHSGLVGGSISLLPSLLSHVVSAIVEEFMTHDACEALTAAISDLGARRGEERLAVCSWWALAIEEIETSRTSGETNVGHAGELETSMLLAIDPSLVDMSLAPDPQPPSSERASALSSVRGQTYRWLDFARRYRAGVSGYPRSATPALGQTVLDAAALALARLAASL